MEIDQHTVELVLQAGSLIGGVAVMRHMLKQHEQTLQSVAVRIEKMVERLSHHDTSIEKLDLRMTKLESIVDRLDALIERRRSR